MKKIISVLAVAFFALSGIEAQRFIKTDGWTKTLEENVTYTLKPDGSNVVIKEGENDLESFTQPVTITFTSISTTVDKGVTINGVKWATRNVGAPGTFVDNPENAGMFYKWNTKIGWSYTDPLVNSNGGTEWDDSNATGTSWATANDPSPNGWRVPMSDEIRKLVDASKVAKKWTTQNGIYGMEFKDNDTGNTLFLPAVGLRNRQDGKHDNDSCCGYYGCSTPDGNNAYYLHFQSSYANLNGGYWRGCGFSVRSVAK